MKKTSKDLAPLAIPHGPPIESTSEYFKSRMETSRMIKKYPVWDVSRPTPQVLIEQARRDLAEADQKLTIKREEEKNNRSAMDAKWHELREKETLLKDSFISFNKFIRENQEKRDRAQLKMQADLEILDRKTQETEAMKARVAEMEEVKELMEKQVQDYAIYEDYLMSVVRDYPEFKQPLDVLNRYEALAAAKTTLAERQERDLEMLEDARQEIAALTEEKKLSIMGLNNVLADLRWRYDKARNRVLKWELALNRLKETAAKRHVELCHVRSAIWSLYVKICKQKGLPIDVKSSDFEQQLVVIMRALIELRRIYQIAQHRSKEKKAIRDYTRVSIITEQEIHISLGNSAALPDCFCAKSGLWNFLSEKVGFLSQKRDKVKKKSSETNQKVNYYNYLVLPLKLVACWEWFERPKKDYQIIINNVYLSFMLFLLLNMVVSLSIHIYLVWQGVMSSLDLLSEALPPFISIIIISYFSVYKNDLYELLEFINTNFKWHSASGVTNMTMQRSYDTAQRFAYYYTACVTFSVTVYTIIPIADHLTTNAVLPWMYNEEVNQIFFILLIRQCLAQAAIGLAIGQLGVFFVTTSILLCGQLDLLCCSLRNVRYTGLLKSGVRHTALLSNSEEIVADEEHRFTYNESNVESPQFHFDNVNNSDGNISSYDIYDRTFDEDTCSAMEDCARVHQVIKEFKIMFEKFISPLLVVRVIHCTIYLCALLYTATLKFDLAIFEYLFAVALDMFFYCYFGNQVIIQSDRVSEAGYQSAWITMGVRPRRMLLNILLSSRRSLVIRAGNFLAIDLQTFIRILKTSFSYYTLLINVNEK